MRSSLIEKNQSTEDTEVTEKEGIKLFSSVLSVSSVDSFETCH